MVNVGIADLNVVKYPDVLATYALGSCVGICLYDHKAKIAGMAHIMLPSSADMPTRALRSLSGKCAATGQKSAASPQK